MALLSPLPSLLAFYFSLFNVLRRRQFTFFTSTWALSLSHSLYQLLQSSYFVFLFVLYSYFILHVLAPCSFLLSFWVSFALAFSTRLSLSLNLSTHCALSFLFSLHPYMFHPLKSSPPFLCLLFCSFFVFFSHNRKFKCNKFTRHL